MQYLKKLEKILPGVGSESTTYTLKVSSIHKLMGNEYSLGRGDAFNVLYIKVGVKSMTLCSGQRSAKIVMFDRSHKNT